jgi:uncharacterized Ntn-hydrolase superfamily protein
MTGHRMAVVTLALLVCLTAPLPAATPPQAAPPPPAAAPGLVPPRPVHTFSIVARDPVTGDLGVAVQSHWFTVGSVVPWAEAGVGAVATQSFVRIDYGPEGLALMRKGVAAPEALKRLIAADQARDVRQVAMIDAKGRVDAYTGAKCIRAAGDHVGAAYSVQANLMVDASVWPAMARAYEAARGDLADRLLAALDAAQAAGGDIRGRQSAAIIIVGGTRSDTPWKDRRMDLRVEDHPQPLKELRRLVGLWRAYEQMNAGDLAVEKNAIDEAINHYAAAETMVPDMDEFVFWHAATLAEKGRVDESLPIFARAFRMRPSWMTLVPRLPASGLLPDDPKLIETILSVGPKAE